jgi:hypothetical protein
MQIDCTDKLQELKADLEAWRSQKNGHKHIPKQLWIRAYDLLNYYPINVLSTQLRLEYNKLKKHMPVAASQSIKPKEAFLELKASDISQKVISQLPEQSCRMVFERLDGNKLTVHIPTDLEMIKAIFHRFLRA